ncbi:MAG: hypothetical protein D6714_04610 [Bacteroidetes bacterium]|nr:MAG: hypothetical protein D6714_04610 [Bacteroidota bacterium]
METGTIFTPPKIMVPLRRSLIWRHSKGYKDVAPPGLMRVKFVFLKEMKGLVGFGRLPQVRRFSPLPARVSGED